MSTPSFPRRSARPAGAYRRPFLLTSAVTRVALALLVSAALWLMTAWAMEWHLF